MTGRDAAVYVLINGYDEAPLVVFIDGKPVQVLDIAYEPAERKLVVLPDYTAIEKGE